jgi:hypothetical protein
MVFYNLSQNSANYQIMWFFLPQTKASLCKFVALATYASPLFIPCIVNLHWVEVYLAFKYAVDKEKQVQSKHRICCLVLVLGIILGSGVTFLDTNTVCAVQVTLVGKIVVTCLEGVLHLCIILSMIFVQRKMEQTRKASGRAKGPVEKAVKIRFCFLGSVIAAGFVVHILVETGEIGNNFLHYSLLYIHQTIVPIFFPVLFGLSTRHFRKSVIKMFNCCASD